LLTGDYGLADRLFERLLWEDRARLGQAHPDALASLDGLAAARGFQGDIAACVRLSLQGAQIREESLGPCHPDTLAARRRAAEARLRGADVEGCCRALLGSLEATERALGPGSLEALTLKGTLGAALLSRGRRGLGDAVRHLRGAHAGLSALLGHGNRDVHATGVNLAVALCMAGEGGEGQRLLEASARGLEGCLGKGHPEAELARRQLVAIRQAMRAGG
jgi:hypothetical protein